MALRRLLLVALAACILLLSFDSSSSIFVEAKKKCKRPKKASNSSKPCRKPSRNRTPPPPKRRPPPPPRRRPPPPPMSIPDDFPIIEPIPSPSPPPPPPPPPPPSGPVLFTYELLQEMDRDVQIFTQGLNIVKKCDTCEYNLFSSSGLTGKSKVIEQRLNDGQVLQTKDLASDEFGEGIASVGDKMYQVLFQSNKLLVYDINNLNNVEVKQQPLDNGWGITYDGSNLIISDGSNKLTFVDIPSLSIQRQVSVTFEGSDVYNLNEMEWVNGLVYANVWMSDCFAKIDPSNGNVVGWVLLDGLKKYFMDTYPPNPSDPVPPYSSFAYDVNGIAVKPGQTSPLYVTGKFWSKLFVIQEKVENDGNPMTNDDIDRVKSMCLRQSR